MQLCEGLCTEQLPVLSLLMAWQQQALTHLGISPVGSVSCWGSSQPTLQPVREAACTQGTARTDPGQLNLPGL